MHIALLIVGTALVVAVMAAMFAAAAVAESMAGFIAAIGTCLLIAVTIAAFTVWN